MRISDHQRSRRRYDNVRRGKKIAINKDDYSEEIFKDFGLNKDDYDLKEARAIEVGDIYSLGEKYSKALSLSYKDQEGKDKNVFMGSYGIGVSRLVAAAVEVSHDERGIIWPKEIAPFQVHLIGLLGKDENSEAAQKAAKIYEDLSDSGVEVLYDDRLDASVGEKFADADLIGCPIRLVVSEKTLKENSVEYKERADNGLKMIKINNIIKEVIKNVK
ncbi:hypothetical protein GF382_03125 [Candidatus Falkowbacteria bacterium]|nr:hypothetical protein [Candidatus Falkowbacteria bacterium]